MGHCWSKYVRFILIGFSLVQSGPNYYKWILIDLSSKWHLIVSNEVELLQKGIFSQKVPIIWWTKDCPLSCIDLSVTLKLPPLDSELVFTGNF